MHRIATFEDLSSLIDLERRCFDVERLSERNFRYLLTRAKSQTLIDEVGGQMRGYVTILWRQHLQLARIYSIAVDAPFRGQKVGLALIEAAEKFALKFKCVRMRAEIRQDNIASQRMFARLGYIKFGEWRNYYEDHQDAVRVEKLL